MRTMTAILPLVAASVAMGQQIQATVNGQPVIFNDVQPMTMNGRVLVPVRGVFEQMGVNVDWEPATQTVTANGNGNDVVLGIGKRVARVNDHRVRLDVPAMVYHGRTMVPLRFISESMGAQVNWYADNRLVAINTNGGVIRTGSSTTGVRAQPMARTVVLRQNTVIPVTLNTSLSSNTATVGQRFTATVDPLEGGDYMGLPAGTVVYGHVDSVRARTSDAPGVLGLAFDRVEMANGRSVDIDGSLIGLDNKSVTNSNGRLVAKQSAKSNMKYVGIGAGAGALIGIATKSNVLTTTVLGAALGYLYDQSQMKNGRDVTLNQGTKFGVVLNRDETFPAY